MESNYVINYSLGCNYIYMPYIPDSVIDIQKYKRCFRMFCDQHALIVYEIKQNILWMEIKHTKSTSHLISQFWCWIRNKKYSVNTINIFQSTSVNHPVGDGRLWVHVVRPTSGLSSTTIIGLLHSIWCYIRTWPHEDDTRLCLMVRYAYLQLSVSSVEDAGLICLYLYPKY